MTYTRRPRVRVAAPPDDTWDSVMRPHGRPMYYNRAGQPCTMREWTEIFEDPRRRFVGQDYVLGAWVATIYDGLNQDILEDGPPTMFETTVFRKDADRALPAYLDGYQIRYASEREALEGHWEIRKLARAMQQVENGPPPLWPGTVKRRRR